MPVSTASHQVHSYTIATSVYEGPLDLLLQLIEKAELDITKLALAQVTDQYLEHLRQLEVRAAEEVSAFLVIATRLLQIKSEALLPRPVVRETGEEDPGEALAQQLIAYKRYRQIAELLARREAAGLRAHLRLAPPPKVEGVVDLSDLGLADLVAAAQEVFNRTTLKQPLSTLVAAPRITIREKIGEIARALRAAGGVTFRSLLKGNRNRLDIVVTFLAMLELVKRHFITARQENLFGDIAIEPTSVWEEGPGGYQEFETEFGE